MENNLEYRRRLPPELLSEIHKCLPLVDAIYVLVNVPTRAIYQNNSPRIRRTIERLKMSLKEYADILAGDDDEEEEEEEEDEDDDVGIVVNYDFEWKPQFDAFLRYGTWLTSDRQLFLEGSIVGVPENFVEKLLLYLTNSGSTQTMLDYAYISFEKAPIPVPTFLKPLFDKKKYQQMGDRFLIDDCFELKTEDGQILQIYEAEWDDIYELNLILVNKDKKNWFKIYLMVDNSEEIWTLEFRRWKMQSLSDIKISLNQYNGSFEQSGNILEAKKEVLYEAGKWMNFDKNNFHILSAKTAKPKKKWLEDSSRGPTIFGDYKLEFTLANIPTSGEYVFDVFVQYANGGFDQIAGIKIQKRKVGDNIELNCNDQIEQRKKRKLSNNGGEDEPTCSSKIMKK